MLVIGTDAYRFSFQSMPDTCQNRIMQDAVTTLLTKTTLKGDSNTIFSRESTQQQRNQLGLRMSIVDHTNQLNFCSGLLFYLNCLIWATFF